MTNKEDCFDSSSARFSRAASLAADYTEGLEVRCQRWRRQTSGRRGISMVVLLALILLLIGLASSSIVSHVLAIGVLPTGEAVRNIQHMLISL